MTQQFSGDQLLNSGQSKPELLECPRCSSRNTKFCYYNNYNKSQPRHFCRSCKRHWTKGGTLRNIPAGRRRPRTAPPPPQDSLQYSRSLSTDHDDNMSRIIYQALARSSSPQSTILESNGTTYTDQNAEFTFSTSTDFNCIPTSNYQSSGDNIFDFVEKTAVSTSAAPPWMAVNPSTAADVWNWNEIDFFDAAAAYKPIFEESYYLS